jgi:2,3-bisphosphoglycerate-dependent phosphoglycerate mutase
MKEIKEIKERATLQFYFIRHAQSANNHLYATTGASVGRSSDPELTALGKQQADILARFLREENFGITHLYTSLMVRAIATGTIVADALGLRLTAWEDWHETGGIYSENPATGEKVGQPGKNRAELSALFPNLVLPEMLGDAGWWNCRPFEERDQRPARAERVWRDLLARHGDTNDRVAVISHGGFYNYFLAAILRLTNREGFWFLLNNACITRLDIDPEFTQLTYLNRHDHLPHAMITE